MKSFSNCSLKNFNTFGIDVQAKTLIEIEDQTDLVNLMRRGYASEFFVIGGGSNMLLTEDIDKTVLHINNKGIKIVEETEDHVKIQCQAGENWHQFVHYCVNQNYGGFENLALIPGNVGTAPIQNIGAYGTELKDCFVECSAVNLETSELQVFSKEECQFGYRDSIFKRELKDQVIIDSVTFKLTKKEHSLNLDYGSISEELSTKNITNPGIKDVFEVVQQIRQAKLPDPAKIGNCGSFFKNPVLSSDKFEQIKTEHPNIRHFELENGQVKIPAGWMIDQAGFKGYKKGNVGVHKNQALVLINLGQATGKEVIELAVQIQKHIQQQFGIKLQPEVNIFPKREQALLS